MGKNKVISIEQVLALFKPGASVMVGGFGGVGFPSVIVNALADSDSTSDLYIIANDSGLAGHRGMGALLASGKVKKLMTTYVNGNPAVSDMIQSGKLETELVPIGTLVERIRADGAGLGGVLTPTGLNTVVAEGKEIVNVNGRDYLLEKPLHADIAAVRAWKADTLGNLVFRRQQKTYNTVMVTAADIVIAEVEELVDPGELDPDEISAPFVLVDYIVKV